MHSKGVMLVVIGGGAKAPSPEQGGKSPKKKGCPLMISVPIEALSASSENGEGVSPEVGDTIELQNVMGVLKSIDGGKASVEIQSVNGEAAEYVKHGSMSEERDDLMEKAMKADEEAGYEM